MTVNDWYSLSQLGSVVTLFLTFAFGAAAILTGLRVNRESAAETERIKATALKDRLESAEKIGELNHKAAVLTDDAERSRLAIAAAQLGAAQANERALHLEAELEKAVAESTKRQTELEVEQRRTAEAQEKAAKAQLELQQRVEYVHKVAGDRVLSPRFEEALKGRPVGTAEILYRPEDTEAYGFALDVWHALQRAGWNVLHPKPIPDTPNSGLPDAPRDVKYGSGTLALIANRELPFEFGDNTALGAIWDAVRRALDTNWGFISYPNPSLADDHFIIVVGQK